MARKQILFGHHGRIVFNKPGPPVQHDFGTFVPVLDCGTTTGGTGLNKIPSMVLSIAGTSGTINWCGLTWNLPADSGKKQEVCPGVHNYEIFKNAAGYPATWGAGEQWAAGIGGSFLYMRRRIGKSAGYYVLLNRLWLNVGTLAPAGRFDIYYKATMAGTTQTFSSIFQLGLISGVYPVTQNDYRLTDDFFGSYTNNGVTYTWARGTNW